MVLFEWYRRSERAQRLVLWGRLSKPAADCQSACRDDTFPFTFANSKDLAGHLNIWMNSLPGLVVQRQFVEATNIGRPFLSCLELSGEPSSPPNGVGPAP